MLSLPLTCTLWHAEKLPNRVIAHPVAVRLHDRRRFGCLFQRPTIRGARPHAGAVGLPAAEPDSRRRMHNGDSRFPVKH